MFLWSYLKTILSTFYYITYFTMLDQDLNFNKSTTLNIGNDWTDSMLSIAITEILNKSSQNLFEIKEKTLRLGNLDPHTEPLAKEIANIIRDTIKTIIILLDANDINNPSEVIIFFREHEFFNLSIGSSKSAMHALTKPYWYAGDMHLMVQSCKKTNPWNGYEKLTNIWFLDFPTAESVRQRAKSLFETLKRLPDGSKVMNLACWPALEVQWFLEVSDKDIEFFLLDNDPVTLEYLEKQEMDERAKIMEANAFKINSNRLNDLCGNTKLDLAYSSGLFDYIPDKFAPRITQAMFNQLKVWWKLIIWNYLKPSDTNPHPKRQKFVMDEILDWKLIYRSPEEIKTFLSKIDPDTYKYHINTEFFGTNPNCPTGSIGFLIAEKIK